MLRYAMLCNGETYDRVPSLAYLSCDRLERCANPGKPCRLCVSVSLSSVSAVRFERGHIMGSFIRPGPSAGACITAQKLRDKGTRVRGGFHHLRVGRGVGLECVTVSVRGEVRVRVGLEASECEGNGDEAVRVEVQVRLRVRLRWGKG